MRLVLLPGLNGSDRLFAPLRPCLDSLHIECCSIPEQGQQTYAALTEALLPKLGSSPYVLLGESFSGPLAYAIAQHQPPGLRGVILAASFLQRPHPLLALTPYLPLPRNLLRAGPLLRLFCVNGQASPELLELLRGEISQLPTALIRQRLLTLNQLQAPKQPLTLPVLHLHARQDRLITRKAAASVRQHCQDLRQIDIDGPHFLLQSQPQASAKAIRAFIEELIQQDSAVTEHG